MPPRSRKLSNLNEQLKYPVSTLNWHKLYNSNKSGVPLRRAPRIVFYVTV